jgi:quercetin dioxygenase-like cupin family protein/DNA-binding transcriptional regulator YiaG
MDRKPSKKDANSMGMKIGLLRKKSKMTIEELSEKTGLSVAHLTELEEGRGFAPVGDMLRIARVLTIDPSELLQKSGGRDRDLEKRRISDFRMREQAYRYEVLTPQAKKDHLRSFRIMIPPHSEHTGVSYQHEGEEFIYVLKGTVEVTVGHTKHRLKKDETLHFDSGIRHMLKNPGSGTTVLIVTLYTP